MTNNVYITNSNGRFYAGMTLADAKARGVDKCTFRRDFYNVDKNGDGVLSTNEIMAERKRDANCEKWSALIFGAWGLVDYFTTHSGNGRAIWVGIDALLTAFSLHNYFKINKETEKYIEQLNKNHISINA